MAMVERAFESSTLAEVIAAWPGLSDEVRAQVMAMVRAITARSSALKRVVSATAASEIGRAHV